MKGLKMNKIFSRKNLYLVLSIIGLVYTMYYNVQYFATAPDASFSNFFRDAAHNFPGKSLVADLRIVVMVFFVFYIPDAIKLKIRFWWILVPLTYVLAIAFTFPMYLYLRERKIEKDALESVDSKLRY